MRKSMLKESCMKSIFFVAILVCNLSSSVVYAEEGTDGYIPTIKNKMNPDAYDWNALNTKWVNMRVLGMVALDGSHFIQNGTSRTHVGDLSAYNVGDVRGIRIGAAGTINFKKPWTYLMSGSINSPGRDFNSGVDDKYTLLDLVLGIPLWGEYGRMQIGKMKAPISMERNMGMVFEQVMERPMHLDALLPSRNIGLSVSDMIFDSKVTYKIGIYNDWLAKKGVSVSQSNQQYAGRITTVAYEDKEANRLLHLGAGYRYEDIAEGTIHYAVGPENYFVDPWLDTGEFEAQSSSTYNLEVTYLDGPLWVAAEHTSTSVNSARSGDPKFGGYHVSASYLVTGEHRGYNRRLGVVRRVTPLINPSDRGVGAVELSARYSFMDLNGGAINGGKMNITSLGVIWHPRRNLQFHCQYSRANLHNKNIKPISTVIASRTDILQFRMVILVD